MNIIRDVFIQSNEIYELKCVGVKHQNENANKMNNTLTNTIDDLFAVSGYLMEIALRIDPDISNFTPVFEALATPVEQLSFKIGEWMVAGEAPKVQEWFTLYSIVLLYPPPV